MASNVENACEICRYLPNNQWLLFETEYWKVTLCPTQRYLGRSYVGLKRHAADLTSLTHEEWSDLKRVIEKFEDLLTKAFDARVFNWACLMNNAFQEELHNPHVHWHVRPRYQTSVELEGVVFEDPEFGFHYDRAAEDNSTVSVQVLDQIKQTLVKQL